MRHQAQQQQPTTSAQQPTTAAAPPPPPPQPPTAAANMAAVKKLNELVHECNQQLCAYRNCVTGIGTTQDNANLRRDLLSTARACIRACEAAKNSVLPQLRNEAGPELTKAASQFIGCTSSVVLEMRRCAALERTFPAPTESAVQPAQIEQMEAMLETLENLITVHFSTSEGSPADVVVPRRQHGGGGGLASACRPSCVCSKLKTSYA